MRNTQVVEAWLRKKRARSGNGFLRSDGTKLYSYKVVIGEHTEDGATVYDYRGPNKIGLATTRHVYHAIRGGGDEVLLREPPPTVDISAIRAMVIPRPAPAQLGAAPPG